MKKIDFCNKSELYATHLHGRRERESRKPTSTDAILRDLSEIKAGDPVVHEEHGIGRYQGLISMDHGEGEPGQLSEFLSLEYQGGDKLYVPVAQLHLIGVIAVHHRKPRPCISWAVGNGKKLNARRCSKCVIRRRSC